MPGVGSGFAYSPSIVTVAQYFEKRRALANGIAVAGGGVGNFAAPPLIRYLLQEFGLDGTLLVLGGLMLNVCVCGLLLRPTSFYTVRKRISSVQNGKQSGNSQIGVHAEQGMKPWGEGTFQCNLSQQHVELENNGRGIPGENSTDLADNSCEFEADYMIIRKQSSDEKMPSKSKIVVFDYKLLKTPVFWIYGCSVFFAYCGYPHIFMIVPAHAKQLNVAIKEAAFLVSIIGIFDLIGRIGFGWFSDLNILKKRHGFLLSMAVSGLTCCLIPLANSFIGLAVCCSVIGLFAGSFVALIAVILAETVGVDRLPSAFGLIVFCMGSAFLFAPPIVGE